MTEALPWSLLPPPLPPAAEVGVVVCHPDNLPTLTSDLEACSCLKQIVTWGSIPDDVVQRAEEHDVKLATFEEVMVRGEVRKWWAHEGSH